jgi:hypothetical protein
MRPIEIALILALCALVALGLSLDEPTVVAWINSL